MTKKIFIWVAHPKAGSLNHAIADAYEAGAKQKGAQVRRMNLNEMTLSADFDGYTGSAELDPDLVEWQNSIAWADHILIIHPYWWGAMPGKAKEVLDRALTSGFGFKYKSRGLGWEKLLAGKTADAFITSDTPPLLDILLYRKPARRVIKNQVLGFCGVKVKKVVQFGSVKLAAPKKIQGWLKRAEAMGAKASS
ncbi:MAG: NAD(P)H-dependent oxidoreductase [Henriciella sp.]|jgi:putative NADPH-quinone reductase